MYGTIGAFVSIMSPPRSTVQHIAARHESSSTRDPEGLVQYVSAQFDDVPVGIADVDLGPGRFVAGTVTTRHAERAQGIERVAVAANPQREAMPARLECGAPWRRFG